MEALQIQRLEGSLPDGRLCTLKDADRVQRSARGAALGMICGFGTARWRPVWRWRWRRDECKRPDSATHVPDRQKVAWNRRPSLGGRVLAAMRAKARGWARCN